MMWATYRATMRSMLADRAALTMLIGSVLIYSFLYPAFYAHQVAERIPLIVVDQDASPASRALIMKVAALREAEIVDTAPSLHAAETFLQRGDAFGVLLIPARFERETLEGKPGQVLIYGNGAYLYRANALLSGLGAALNAFAGDAIAQQAQFSGVPAPPVVSLISRPLFNTREGYGSSVVPGVAEIIIQQTMLMGIVLLAATRRERVGRLRASTMSVLGIAAAFMTIGLANLLYFAGFVFWFQDYPRGGNLPGLLAGGVAFIAATVALALWLGSYFRTRERALQLIIGTSLPLYFMSGLSWPLHMSPSVLVWLAKLVPTTAGINLMVKVNQMGAHLDEVVPELVNLLLLAVVYGALALWRYRPTSSEPLVSVARPAPPVGDGE